MVEGVKKRRLTVPKYLVSLIRQKLKLAKMVDYVISYPANEQLKFFMVADRFMKNAGEFEDYDEYYAEMDAHLAQGLVDVEKAADAFGAAYAESTAMTNCITL